MFIYILELEQNKYYIGKTTKIAFRLKDHFESNGAAWTRKYKPIQVQSIIADCDDFDEDKYTLKKERRRLFNCTYARNSRIKNKALQY
jgi:predicted GIY-YIG superfamily endonuclease